MRYSGETCPYCGSVFVEGDDVVVCPECATPHHRACWFAHGCCANEEKHGTGFVWQKTVQPEPEKTEEKPQSDGGKSLDIVCPDCGKVSPNGTLRCPECGALLVPFASPGTPPVAQFRPEFNPNEDIGGLKSGDIALLCRSGGSTYIRRFRKLASGKKLTWNWAAFLFTPFWFFYRKLYKPGALLIALFTALSLLTAPYTQVVETIQTQMQQIADEVLYPEQITEQGDEQSTASATDETQSEAASVQADREALNTYFSRCSQLIYSHNRELLPLYLINAALLLMRVFSALFADRIYFARMKKRIPEIRKGAEDERTAQAELFRAGGASLLIGAASYFGFESILMLFDWFTNK